MSGAEGLRSRFQPLRVEGGELVLRQGIDVLRARKEHSFDVIFQRRRFERPENGSVFRQHEIGVLAHDFADEHPLATGEISRAAEADFHDALEFVLGDG